MKKLFTVIEYAEMCSLHTGRKPISFLDGSALLVPALHSNIDMSVLPSLETVLSHGYLASEFMHTQIAFPLLATILLGSNMQIPSSIYFG